MSIEIPEFIPDTSWLHMKPSKVFECTKEAFYSRGVNYFVTYEYVPVGSVFFVSGYPAIKYVVIKEGKFLNRTHFLKHAFKRLDGNFVTSTDLGKFKVGKRLIITGKTA